MELRGWMELKTRGLKHKIGKPAGKGISVRVKEKQTCFHGNWRSSGDVWVVTRPGAASSKPVSELPASVLLILKDAGVCFTSKHNYSGIKKSKRIPFWI